MKILVFSDSHRSQADMIEAIDEQKPDQVIHLGDLISDAEDLTYVYPRLPICMVPGNCEGWTTVPAKKLITLQGKRILLSHGHLWGVKGGYDKAIGEARKSGVDILLFGHTHKPLVDKRGKTLFVNPGSIGDWARPFYAVVTLENGRLDGRTFPLA